ncbi:hypothetical protein BH11MYX4_BH11MYX4_19540 [soil metagenome]
MSLPSRRLVSKLGLALAGLGGAAWIALACSDDPHLRTSPEQAAGGGGACAAKPGELPPADCDNSDNSSCQPNQGCTIDEARCGSKSTCLPLGDNKGKDVLDLRIRRLKIASPAALAGEFIQNNVVTLGIDLAEKSCGEPGKGLFTWLLQVDRKNNTLVTGGSPPSTDAVTQGFCFARFDLGTSHVEPITTKIEFSGDTFRSTERLKVKIPIFTTADLASVIILPITDVQVADVTLSENGNCVGKVNPDALDSNCADGPDCSKWKTAGALGGFITLEEADAVQIALLSKSLCAFFSGDQATCARDAQGKITFQGDFCSTTKSAGGCADSMWLAATFAASAVKIFDGKGTVPACSGESAKVDSGVDAGADAADASDAADGG